MQTIIKAKTAADFLALVPALAGYTPTRSVALVAFHGARTLGVLRVDLPPADADPDTIASTAATFIGLVCRLPDADGIVPVIYCDEPMFTGAGADARPVRTALIDAIRRCADACGLTVKDALCVAADGWGSYLDPGASAHPLSELDAAAQRAALPVTLGPATGDQHTGVALPVVSSAGRDSVETALSRVEDALESLEAATGSGKMGWLDEVSLSLDRASRGVVVPEDTSLLGTASALGSLCDLPAFLESVLEHEPDELGPDRVAALLICLDRPSMRDVALSQWAFDMETGEQLLDAQLAWEDGAAFPGHLAAHMLGEGPRPDIARVEDALLLVRYLAAIAPAQRRRAPLTLAAWLSWALGRSTHAGIYLEWVREIDPDYGLAEIVSAMVRNGHLPEFLWSK